MPRSMLATKELRASQHSFGCQTLRPFIISSLRVLIGRPTVTKSACLYPAAIVRYFRLSGTMLATTLILAIGGCVPAGNVRPGTSVDITEGLHRVAIVSMLGSTFRNYHQGGFSSLLPQVIELNDTTLDDSAMNAMTKTISDVGRFDAIDISSEAPALSKVYLPPNNTVQYPIDHDFDEISPELKRIAAETNADAFVLLLLISNGDTWTYGYGMVNRPIDFIDKVFVFTNSILVVIRASDLKMIGSRYVRSYEKLNSTFWKKNFNDVSPADRKVIIDSLRAQFVRESTDALRELGFRKQDHDL